MNLIQVNSGLSNDLVIKMLKNMFQSVNGVKKLH